MTQKKRVVIYRPDGVAKSYITKAAEAAKEVDDFVVDHIECEPDKVYISWKDEDGTVEGESYVGMPYYLNMW